MLGSGPTTCAEVMHGDVDCCSRADTAASIAASMGEHNIGFVPVCDEEGRVIGTITDRDLALRVVAERRDPETTRAEDVLTPELVLCAPDDTLHSAEELMAEYMKPRILVSDAERHAIGGCSPVTCARPNVHIQCSYSPDQYAPNAPPNRIGDLVERDEHQAAHQGLRQENRPARDARERPDANVTSDRPNGNSRRPSTRASRHRRAGCRRCADSRLPRGRDRSARRCSLRPGPDAVARNAVARRSRPPPAIVARSR